MKSADHVNTGLGWFYVHCETFCKFLDWANVCDIFHFFSKQN